MVNARLSELRSRAFEALQQAMRLSPVYPTWYLYNLAAAYRLTGRYQDAEQALMEVLKRNSNDGRARLDFAIVLAHLGREAEAKTEVAEYLKRDPGNSLRKWLGSRYADDELVMHDLVEHVDRRALGAEHLVDHVDRHAHAGAEPAGIGKDHPHARDLTLGWLPRFDTRARPFYRRAAFSAPL